MMNSKDSSAEWATAFYRVLRNLQQLILFFGFSIVLILPILYVPQEGFTALLWFGGASLVGVILTRLWRPVGLPVRSYRDNLAFKKAVEKHLVEVYSESKFWVIGLWPIFYILAIIGSGARNYHSGFPSDAGTMATLAIVYAVSVYFIIQGLDLTRAKNLGRLSRTFDVREDILKRLTDELPLAPRTLSINVLSAIMFVIGGLGFGYGVVSFLCWVAGTPVPILGWVPRNLGGAEFGLIFIMFAIGTLATGRWLRKMNRAGGVCTLVLAIGTALSIVTVLWRFGPLLKLPNPLYLNLTWILGVPLVVCILMWRNWGKMRWTEEDRKKLEMLFGK